MSFSVLEQTILKAKGLTDENLSFLNGAGVSGKADFATIGSVETLLEIMPGLNAEVANKVMEWAVGAPKPAAAQQSTALPQALFVDSADAVYCVHCNAKQPKDYKSGDLCPACGKQAEPVQSCYWCGQSGPGKFCRGCGAEFVPLAEFDLAVLLKREGVAKEEISGKLKSMSPADKDLLWGRVRRVRS
jgi:NAD-dependent SIR2 family protein deacetylase